jgi:two-component system, sensor histidine kinase PdtaS
VALASGLIFIIVAIFVFLCFQGYATTVDGAKAKAQTAADIVADDVDFALDGGLAALQLVAGSITSPSAMTAAQKASFDAAITSFPWSPTLGIYDASGNIVPASASMNLPASIAATAGFTTLANGDNFVVLPQGEDAASGEATILVAQRLGGETFAGVALLSIPGRILEQFWGPQDLGKDSTLNVHRDDGEMVGRYPALTTPVSAKDSPNWPLIQSAESGSYVAVSPIDHVQRVVAFRHIADLSVVVFATVSLDAALGGLWSSIITVCWLIGPIALALLVGSLITANLLRRSMMTQESLAAAVASNDLLFREIHHRVKNNLQSVASLLQMQPIPREVKADMGQRIAAMSAVHEHIYRSNDFAHVQVKDYLQTLIENIRAGRPDVTVDARLEDLSVDKDAATPLGLILNEVVSNAFKHAFKDGRAGVVSVELRRLGDSQGCLTVEDNGVGFDPDVPAKGIGRRLVGALTQQLGGESGFAASANGGARFTLSFPLSGRS